MLSIGKLANYSELARSWILEESHFTKPAIIPNNYVLNICP